MQGSSYAYSDQVTQSALLDSNGLTRNWGCKIPTGNLVGCPHHHMLFITQVPVGELEAMFTMSACRTANLEWIMQEQGLQDSIRPLVEKFSKISNEDHRGTRLADEVHFPPNKPPKTVKLDPDVHQPLLQLVNSLPTMDSHSHGSLYVLELEKVSISGIIYASEKSLPRNSNIIFWRPGGSCDRVGRVKLIFQSGHQPRVTFLAVSQHKLIANADPWNVYQRFGFAEDFFAMQRRTIGFM